MNTLHKAVALAVAFSSLAVASAARAQEEGPWQVRLRALYLDPANKSDALGEIPKDAVHINGKWLPDVDFEYFFTPTWSTELVLTYPQSQDVTLMGTGIGTFKHLPPTLTAKYNFNPDGMFRPYLGAGVNLTLISNVDLSVPGLGALDLSRSSFGAAAQAGFDVKLADHWFLNADVKWVQIRADVKYAGTKLMQARIDPLLYGIGIGYRFGGTHASAPAKPVAPPPAPAPLPPPAPAAAPPPPPPPPPPVAPPAPVQEVVLKGVTFETASAKLKAESTPVLDGVVASIQKCGCGAVAIRGYTDSVGKPAYNQALSERRAQAVKDYLVAHGIPATQLTAEGFGEEHPIADNATPAGRAENRRVTIEFKELARR